MKASKFLTVIKLTAVFVATVTTATVTTVIGANHAHAHESFFTGQTTFGKGAPPKQETWMGNGQFFDSQGNSVGTYDILVSASTSGKTSNRLITVTLGNGTQIQQKCDTTYAGTDAWTSKCDYGTGGGRCFGDGLCLDYSEDGKGTAFASNIVFDSPSDLRILRTELKNGQAVRFFREKLHKK